MGPRLFSRGNALCEGRERLGGGPSMGPRLFSRGNGVIEYDRTEQDAFNGAATLQSRK